MKKIFWQPQEFTIMSNFLQFSGLILCLESRAIAKLKIKLANYQLLVIRSQLLRKV